MVHVKTGTTFTGPAPVPPPVAGDTVITEVAYGQASNAGALASYSREDHTHGTMVAPVIPAPGPTVVTEQAFGQASNAGALATYSREDHTHGTPPNPGGGGGGHLGCGGGTLVGGVPLYNYEDHDLFNTSWCWHINQSTQRTNWVGVSPWIPQFLGFVSSTVLAANGMFGTTLGTNAPGIGSGVAFRSNQPFWYLMAFPNPTHHCMIRYLLDLDPRLHLPTSFTPGTGTPNWTVAVGFWQQTSGFQPNPGGATNRGIGFAYVTDPLLFPNPNWYMVSSSNNPATMFKIDTGIPINDTVKHKFNVIWKHASCDFYIDDLYTGTITEVAAGAGWPSNQQQYEFIATAWNRDQVGPSYMTQFIQFPVIQAADFVPTGP